MGGLDFDPHHRLQRNHLPPSSANISEGRLLAGAPAVTGRAMTIPGVRRSDWLQSLFWCALVFALVMALLPQPPHLSIDSFGDKFEHSLAFGVLALLGSIAYSSMPLLRLGERLSFLGAMIELLQSIPRLHRDCDIMDWVADTVAVTVVLCLVYLVRRSWRRSQPQRAGAMRG